MVCLQEGDCQESPSSAVASSRMPGGTRPCSGGKNSHRKHSVARHRGRHMIVVTTLGPRDDAMSHSQVVLV